MSPTKLLALCGLLTVLSFGCSGEQQEMYDGAECQEDGDCEKGFTCDKGYCQGGSAVTDDPNDKPGEDTSIDGGMKIVEASGDAMGAPAGVSPVEVQTEDCTGLTCPIPAGSTVTFRAAAIPGYRFTGWTGDPRCSEQGLLPEITLPNVSENIKCIATYVKRVVVSGASAGAGAQVAAASQAAFASCAEAVCEVDEGSEVTLTAPAVGGHRFAGFLGAGCEQATGTSVTVIAAQSDVMCTASYVQSFEVTGNLAGAVGEIIASSITPFSNCMGAVCVADEAGTVVLTAPSLSGYRFAGWSGDAPCVGSNLALEISSLSADVTCTASYKKLVTGKGVASGTPTNPSPTASTNDPLGTCGGGSCTVDEGSDVVLTAQTIPGYRLLGFTGAGCDAVSGTAVTLAKLASDITCSANYVEGIAISGNVVGATGEVVASSSAAFHDCKDGSCVVDAGSDVTLTAPTIEGFRFTGWSGSPGCTGNAAALTLTKVSVSATCNANYVARFAVSFADPIGGSVSTSNVPANADCNANRCLVDAGAGITLTAAADSGYRFTGWSGCSASTSPQIALEDVRAAQTCTANFVRQWSVAYAAGTGGSVNAPAAACGAGSPCVVDQGSALAITATPSNGYRFASFSGAGCVDSNPSTPNIAELTNIAGPVTCTASFVKLWIVTYSAGAGGSVSASDAQCPSGSPCTLDAGADLAIAATPDAGYRFGGFTGQGCTDSVAATTNVVELANVASNVTCTASFVRQSQVTYAAGTGGSVSAPPSACPSGSPCTIDNGTNLAITATPASGYRFGAWSGAGCSDSAPGTANIVELNNIQGAVTCSATFVRQWTVSYGAGTGGSVNAPQCASGSPCTVDEGSALAITATPASGYRFGGWVGTNCVDSDASTANVANLSGIAAATTCTANFVRQWNVTYSAGTGGSVSTDASRCPSGSPCAVDNGGDLAITATPASGYRFAGFTGSGCSDSVASTPNVLDLSNVTTALTCTANFTRQLTVTYIAGTGGSVSAPAQQCASGSPCVVDQGANLDVTAAPAAGYRFAGWSGTGCTDSAPNTPLIANLTNISAPVTCTASFMRQWTVTYSAGAGGSLTAPGAQCPTGSPCLVDQGSDLDLSATPAAGYRFAGFTGSGCTDTVTSTADVVDLAGIASDVTCTASFVRQWTVTYAAFTGGSVSAPSNACGNGSPCIVDQGANLAITATPASGYRFGGWTGTGCTDSATNTPNVVDLSGISAAITCNASFVRQLNVTYAAGTGGSVAAPANTCPSGSPCAVDEGANLAITATPASGYRFGGWTGTGCTDSVPSTTNVADLSNINAAVTCTASFVRRWTVTFTANNGGTVSAPASACPNGSPCTVDAGADLAVTATPASGYRFGGWTGTGCSDAVASTPSVADLDNIGSDIACTASFVRQWNVTYSAGTGGTVAAPSGQCPTGSPCAVDNGSSLAITATPASGYRFGGWSGTGCTDSATGTANVADLVNIGAAITCTASFVRQWNVTYSSGTGGTVQAPSAQCASGSPCLVDQGANLAITATADAGYRFDSWSGNGCVDSATGTPNIADLSNISSAVTCTASFVRQGAVTYSAGTGGTVSAPAQQCPSGSPCVVDQGSNLSITATPASGYRFGSWTGTGCTDSNTNTPNVVDLVNITTGISCTANFVRQWSVTYSAGAGGTVSAPGNQCPNNSPCTLDEGSNLAITATPTAGYRFAGFTGTGCTDSNPNTANVVDLSNINAAVTCTASFTRQWTVTYTAGNGGTVNAPPAQCPNGSPCTLDQGSNLDITAIPATGYRFGGWSGTGCTDSDTATDTVMDLANVTAAVTCAASFVRQWQVTYSAGTGGSVAAPVAQCASGSPCTVDQGDSLAITATPASGYRFSGWSGTGCADSNANTPAVADLANISAAVTCTASFVRQWQVTYSAGTGGSVSAPSNQCANGSPCTVDQGASLAITATAANGYRFGGWTGAGCTDSATNTPNVADLSNISAAITCTASFVRQWSVTYSAGTGGSVTAPANQCPNNSPCTVDQGTSLAITATASGGYRFGGWTGTGCTDSVTSTANVVDLSNISGAITCTASFVRQWAVTYSAGTGGTVSAPGNVCANGSPCTVDQGTSLAITATPNPGYRFGGFSGTGCTDSVAGTPNVADLANISSAITCNATFVRQWSVTYSAGAGGNVSAPAAQCPNGSPCILDQGSDLNVTAVPASGYRFNAWTGTGCTDAVTNTPSVVDLTNIASAITCTATFVRQWAVTYNAGTGGQVNAPAAQCPAGSPCAVDEGSGLAVTATPASGYRFGGWSGTGCTDSVTNTANVADLANITSAITCTASFVRQWSVTYTAGTGGSISAPGTQCPDGSPCTLDAGSNLALTATPLAGYRFGGFTGTGCTDSVTNTPNVADLANINAAITCTANFVRQWSVTYSAGTGGSVSAPANPCANGSPCTVDQGANLAITATPAAGYRFGAWTGTGCTDSATGTVHVADLSNISSAITCTASFVRQWDVSYAAGVGGTVSAPSAQCPAGSPCAIDNGGSLAITATADAGYRFDSWRGAGCTDSNTNTANIVELSNITAAISCTASFVRQWTVTYSAGTGGSVNAPAGRCPNGSPCGVDAGTDLQITASPLAGYRFGGWSGTGCVDGATGTPNIADLTNISSAITCTASFVRQWTITFTGAPTGGTVTSAPTATCGAAGTNNCTVTVDQGSNVDLTAVASTNPRYRFASWSCTDADTSTPAVLDLNAVAANMTCNAAFTRRPVVTGVAVPAAGGSVIADSNDAGDNCSAGTCEVDTGSNVTLTATASSGYRFTGWSGCSTATTATLTFNNVTNDITNCTANFVARWTVTFTGGPTGGTVTSAPTATCGPNGTNNCAVTVDQGTNVDLTAVASTNPLYRFGGWSCTDADTTTSLVLDLNSVASNMTCNATFIRRPAVTGVAAPTAGGTVTADSNDDDELCSGGRCEIDSGSNVTLSAAANAGYRFTGWSGCSTATTASITFTNVTADIANCTANFVARWTITFTGAPTGGSVASSPAATCGTAPTNNCTLTVDQGTNVDLTATAITNPRYRFGAWSCTDADTSTPTVLDLNSVSANMTCNATFVRRPIVTAVASPSAGGSVTVDTSDAGDSCGGSTCEFDSGSNVTLTVSQTAAQAAAYRFTGWTGCSTSTSTPLTLSAVTTDQSCTANFVLRYTVSGTTSPTGLTVTATSTSTAPVANCGGAQCVVDSGTPVTLTAQAILVPPNGVAQYDFQGWTGAGCSDQNPDNNPRTLQFSSVTSNLSCTAAYRVRITVAADASGASSAVSITDPGTIATCIPAGAPFTSCLVPVGTQVTINGRDTTSTRFSTWSGGTGCAGAAVHALAVNVPTTCTATFYGLWSHTFYAAARNQDLGYSALIQPDGDVLVSGIMNPGRATAWLSELTENEGKIQVQDANNPNPGQSGFNDGTAFQGYGLATNNETYVMAASKTATVATPVMLVLDKERTLLFARQIPTADNANDYLLRSTFHPEIGYTAVGYMETGPDMTHVAAVSASTGQVTINRRMCLPQVGSCQRPLCQYTRGADIVRTREGFAVASYAQPDKGGGPYRAVLTFLDPKGSTINEVYYTRAEGQVTHDLIPSALIATSDGGFLMVGRTKDFAAATATYDDGFAMKLSSDGGIQWQTRIGTDGVTDQFNRVAQSLVSENYVLVGTAAGVNQNQDGWLVTLNKDGVVLPDNPNTRINERGERAYDLSNSLDVIFDVAPMFGGGHAIAGYRYTLDPGNFDFWAMRVDEEGDIGFNATSNATMWTPTHAERALGATADKIGCFLNDDRYTQGVDLTEAVKKNTIPFNVTDVSQAP